MAATAESPSTGGFVLWLHGSGGSGDESRAQVAPYFSDPGVASSVRLSFPTAPTSFIPCYGERRRRTCHPIQPIMFTYFPGDELMVHGPRRTVCFYALQRIRSALLLRAMAALQGS